MRLFAVLFAIFAVSTPAAADERQDAVAEILTCSSVRGDKARLRCFERTISAVRDTHPEAIALADVRAEEARIAAQKEAKEEFGLSAAEAQVNDPFEEKEFGAEDIARADGDDDDGDVKSIESAVLEVGRTAHGKIIVILENGQVWRQIDGDSSTPYIRKNIDGLTARVKKAAFGSYSIRISGTRDAFKARRVK